MGVSLHTNQSAMSALQTLHVLGNNLDATERRVSSGYRVNDAAEAPAYWSISSMMKSDTEALSAVSRAMELGKAQIGIAYETTTRIKASLDAIQKELIIAIREGKFDNLIERKPYIQKHMNDIKLAVISSELAEKNILVNNGDAVDIAGAYRREGSAVYIDMIDIGGDELNFGKKDKNGSLDLTQGVLKGVFAETGMTMLPLYWNNMAKLWKRGGGTQLLVSLGTRLPLAQFLAMTPDELSKYTDGAKELMYRAAQVGVDSVIKKVTTAGAVLGSAANQVQGQIGYVSKLIDGIDKGIGGLIDADMNAESARLSSLQVQQQLAIQALSVANQNSQNILALYKN